jgi:hypothetical protein
MRQYTVLVYEDPGKWLAEFPAVRMEAKAA